MNGSTFDRRVEDVGNILAFEHVNVTIPDQRLATIFYVMGMGFTRDPYMHVGVDNMWINVGYQQFHLPTRGPQVLRGHVGVVVPDRDALLERLGAVGERLKETRFSYAADDDCLRVTCPWGNELRCRTPHPRYGDMTLGIPYVEFGVKRGVARGIGCFYERAFGVRSALADGGDAVAIPVGRNQQIVFRERDGEAPYDGHHIAIYIADFSGPHRFLKERGLVTEESDQHQYRFRTIVDPESGTPLFEIEHEVRSVRHPMWGRTFVNRNPAQTQRNYQRGRDTYYG